MEKIEFDHDGNHSLIDMEWISQHTVNGWVEKILERPASRVFYGLHTQKPTAENPRIRNFAHAPLPHMGVVQLETEGKLPEIPNTSVIAIDLDDTIWATTTSGTHIFPNPGVP